MDNENYNRVINPEWERAGKLPYYGELLITQDIYRYFNKGPIHKQYQQHKPPMNTMTQINNNFTYHKPFGTQPQRYEEIRQQAKNFAASLLVYCPESRELSLAMTNLEQAVMWANAAIARNEKEN